MRTKELPRVNELKSVDTFVINSDDTGATSLITWGYIKSIIDNSASISSWDDVKDKPFSTIGNGLTISNDVISVASDIIEQLHSHDNMAVIDLFSRNGDTLYWNGTKVGADYSLPIASTTRLGGVKIDNDTITITEDGMISASVGASFDDIANMIGVTNGITITSHSDTKKLDFIVDGLPTIDIDADGYWTIDGARGSNPTKAQGEKGADGVSPKATISENTNGAIITIQDASGTTTAQIYNGSDGHSPVITIDDTSYHWMIDGNDTNVVAKGEVTQAEFDELKNMISSLNTQLENTLNGGEVSG